MSLYESIEFWDVPTNLLSESVRTMAPDGVYGNEGIAFWLGTARDGIALVSHLVTLSDHWVVKRPDYLQISADGISHLMNLAEKLNVFLVGQIHSHPGTYVDLSDADRRYGFSTPYFLSVVGPHYAQNPQTSWQDCGIHVYERGSGFRRLNRYESDSRIRIQSEYSATLVHIGRAG